MKLFPLEPNRYAVEDYELFPRPWFEGAGTMRLVSKGEIAVMKELIPAVLVSLYPLELYRN